MAVFSYQFVDLNLLLQELMHLLLVCRSVAAVTRSLAVGDVFVDLKPAVLKPVAFVSYQAADLIPAVMTLIHLSVVSL